MAKIHGLFGAMTGKLADVVMVVRNGEQIVRKYQPVISNPTTPEQVAARAKLKLLSQFAAVAGPIIAIPKQGAVSSRNRFVSKNYGLVTYENDQANISIASVQLTDSNVALPAISATKSQDAISAYVADAASVGALDINRMVYVLLTRDADNRLRIVASRVSTESGSGNTWSVQFPLVTTPAYVLAYGVRDNNTEASVIFGNLTVLDAQNVARLIVTRRLLERDVTLTETRGYVLPVA